MHAYYHFLIMVYEWDPYSLPYDGYVFHAFITTKLCHYAADENICMHRNFLLHF